MKITNFRKNYAGTFRSLDDVAHKLDWLERRGNGHGHNNSDNNNELIDFDFERMLYENIKMPSVEVVAIWTLEHPYYSSEEIADIMRHRLDMRYYFPDKFKTPELARGDEYLIDEMEEYREDMLDAIEKERLRRQRARRQKIGTITSIRLDRQNGVFHYEHEMSDEWDAFSPSSQEEYLDLLYKEKDI